MLVIREKDVSNQRGPSFRGKAACPGRTRTRAIRGPKKKTTAKNS